ncbi:hypothetical protein [Enterococcus mundtii]|uniref:hypothetical protein n=1 Tax=Enterococcus mundtii TaxID=53346 RepID=UPI001A95C5D5|nr:hypothetical protein [Enterococcus mundtii]MBO1087138.1 hypothetical protein [Enterococcus mundtii]
MLRKINMDITIINCCEKELMDTKEFARKNSYYSFERIYLNGMKGTLYGISEPERDYKKMKQLESEHSNVIVLGGHNSYTPEQKRIYIFVADKKLGRILS